MLRKPPLHTCITRFARTSLFEHTDGCALVMFEHTGALQTDIGSVINRFTRFLLLNRTHMFLNDACSKKRHGTCVRQRHDDQVHEHACLLSQMQHVICLSVHMLRESNASLNCIAHVVGHGPLLFLYIGVHDEHANWLVSKLALQEPRLIARQRNLLLHRTHMFLNDACSKQRHRTCVRQRHDDQVHEHAKRIECMSFVPHES